MGSEAGIVTVYPTFLDYTVQQIKTKYKGGYVEFTFPSNTIGAVIDTTLLDMSVWIRDLNVSMQQPMTVVMNLNDSINLWTATTREGVFGFTLPKRIFDLGQATRLYYVRIHVIWNTAVANNHEFFLWGNNRVIKTVRYS
jgi:hypothetical protein